nr:IS3 family transposase [uncultured Desulfobacter sp.]
MISSQDKQRVMDLIAEACASGARKRMAAELMGLSLRAVQRWEKTGITDRRIGSGCTPVNKLSDQEQQQIIDILKSPEFADLSPKQIVPRLADQEIYIGSESTMHRILRRLDMSTHRQSSRPAQKTSPDPLLATGPNQIWSWDITYLPSNVKGQFYYLYMIMDIYSRKVVSWQVYDCESGDLAADLITDACMQENVHRKQVTLHSDNGSPMKSVTMLAKLQELGVMPSFSRPSVSNDNPYSESLFKTLKYRPDYPEKPFRTIWEARIWGQSFVNWYNNIHLHSGIRFVTPSDRHNGMDIAILDNRHKIYQMARQRHPERWSGETRNWEHDAQVVLKKVKRLKTKNGESSHKRAA